MIFLVVRTSRKTVGPVYHAIGGHKRMTGEAGIATPGVSLGCFSYLGNSIGITLEIEDSITISRLASLS